MLIDLFWTCVTNMFPNLTQLVGVPLSGVISSLGSFAVVEQASFSSSSRLCVASNSASFVSCHICLSCSSCHKCNPVKRHSSSRRCSCLGSNRLSISPPVSSCLLFKNFASFSLSTRNVEYLTFMSFFDCLTYQAGTSRSIFNCSACKIRSANLPTIFYARLLAIC